MQREALGSLCLTQDESSVSDAEEFDFAFETWASDPDSLAESESESESESDSESESGLESEPEPEPEPESGDGLVSQKLLKNNPDF